MKRIVASVANMEAEFLTDMDAPWAAVANIAIIKMEAEEKPVEQQEKDRDTFEDLN